MKSVRRVLKPEPGVLIGVSTNNSCNGSAIFYDGNKPILELDLGEPMPSIKSETGTEPGLDIQIFCKESIEVEYPEGVDIEFFVN